jgi:pullulanase/glycogen debranching enzyme
MKARTPTKTSLQEIKDEYNRLLQEAVAREHTNAIELCIVTRTAADVDSGLAESTVLKTTKRWKSYIDSVHSGNVTLQEIKDTLKEENGITFDWMEGESK